MAERYRAYSEYKDSGVEWVGDMPLGWELSKHKYIAVFKKGRNPSHLSEEPGENFVRYLSMDYLRGNSNPNYALPETGCYLAQSGQPLIIWDGSNAGEFVRAKGGLVSSTMAASELIGAVDAIFYWYICLCLEPEMRRFANGMGIPHVDGGKLKSSIIPLPSFAEQTKITNFLDHETAKIDTLIDKQQQLIKLLKEKRQAVISHTVTKGLNPEAPMRDSGVEWLGEVPEHWDVTRVKFIAKLESGHTPDKKIQAYWIDCDIPWVSLNDSQKLKEVDYISDTKFKVNALGIENSSARLLPKRCVVFTRDASIGLTAITTTTMAVSQHLIAWVCNDKKMVPEYLLLVFYAMEDELERYTFGATIKTIGMPDVKKLTCAHPDLPEQRNIIEYVFEKKQAIDAAIHKAERSIELLKERRTALISAAVTGKIDVRNWQAPTPNQTNKEEAA